MDAIFTLPYSEYEVINQLQTKFKKNDGYSFCIPTSRQQKGIDFVLYNIKTKKVLSIQVKSSRDYDDKKFKHNLWFKNFKYEPGISDYYILFGLYADYTLESGTKSKEVWKSVMLCFSDKDMGLFLNDVRQKKDKNKKDSSFGISFDEPGKIFGYRGFENHPDYSEYLLKNKLVEITEKLNK